MPTTGLHTSGISSGWTSFIDGSGGYASANWSAYGSGATAMAMWTAPDSTQRIVTAGLAYGSTSNTNAIAVARYNTNGTLDTSFNGTGVASNVLPKDPEGLSAMALQADGGVVVAGHINASSNTNGDVLVARYTVNGALDSTFNGTGWVSTDINRVNNNALAVGLQSTGKIVAAGYTLNSHGQNDSVILRYTSAGKLDSGSGGFGQAGKNGSTLGYTIMSMGSPGQDYDQINALAIQPDDKIVTVGYAYDGNAYNAQLTLMRFTANGLPDTTFNGGNLVLLPPSTPGWSEGYAVTLEPVTVNGQTQTDILVAGDAGPANTSRNGTGFYENFLVARFNPDGSPDTSFNNGSGSISVSMPSGNYDKAYGVALDSSGNIVVGGTWRMSDGTTSGIAVVRLTPNGTLDTTFNSSSANPGIKPDAIPGYANATASGLAIGNDGNYYLAGYVEANQGTYPYSTLLAYFSP
jgi:uncharacterized delta-60 repeat protein